ncbi:SGNH/GDSL hydrolase family protein [Paraflavitalea pollutisoli]|uniref:SGNH/GDSL hydrolase family protein n=1 Tax=Paraflavitalea pollutisoli TaxID=3034143 RepID=UPI0023ED0207|nr:SGNH/GDSL hydrolase family protein [Paraflavitalea sp. H1-2-19X]
MRSYSLSCLYVLMALYSSAQRVDSLQWWQPLRDPAAVIGGRLPAAGGNGHYGRLPVSANPRVRREVWRLSQNSAGLYLEFRTDATEITVRYTLAGNTRFEHMPLTGIAGVDLYAQEANGPWRWAKGKYSFADTVVYRFQQLAATPQAIYRLYLPLYNAPQWLSIGVATTNNFEVLHPAMEAPVVLYGTSILQGACASRAGLAWTNILGRLLDRPLINLGFSGNGRLEPALLQLMHEVPAAAYVLDCLPNLYDEQLYPDEELLRRIDTAVKTLRNSHPQTPIVLVEHAGGSAAFTLDTLQNRRYQRVNYLLDRAFRSLRKQGVRHLHLLRAAKIRLDADGTVDGTHPNDRGMYAYAEAMNQLLRQAIK